MLKNILLLLTFLCTVASVNAQRNCNSMEVLELQMQQDPKRIAKMEAIENATQKFVNNPEKAVTGIITIPVVVHVVYNGSAENISDAQIYSQIAILNEDYRRLNSDADNVWSQAADSEIEFCLASVDPNGNATTGITRTATSVSSHGTDDSVKFTSSGGKDAWPAADYLNVWVCDIGGSILGYAQFPGGSPSTDGVVNDYRYFGDTGTATAPFDLGRTMTHEVGHYLNLRHIWGDGGCSVDDFVSDTPTSDASNGGCALGHVSCGTTDMVQNYMDYSDDACMNLFTAGQNARMRAIFDTGGARESLLNSGACGAGTPATCSDGIQNQGETGIDCGGPCAPCNTNCTDVVINLTFDSYPEETAWSITSGGSTVATGGTYGSQADGSSLAVTVCLADGCYDFTITDVYGDGMCCSYGSGSYNVTLNGTSVASGGSYGSSETTNFCVGGNDPDPTCSDGIQNQGETGVDCGGPCTACPTCNDGIQNQGETGIDCGGPNCADCPPDPTCSDGIQNQGETGVDCGGPCTACPTCNDGIQNQGETGVDCGGPNCSPCNTGGCTDVDVTITFDNYPAETAWSITSGGTTVASGGTYDSQTSGSTLTITNCLSDGCYDFTITDVYGDGICCSYGSGNYNVTINGSSVASGGSFGSSETTNFCVGGNTPTETCSDGIQNQGETDVDCGGPNCSPCNTGGCSQTFVDFNNLDSGWDGWTDGGSDCVRSTASQYANSGTRSIRLRDNTSTSVSTSPNYALAGYEELTVSWSYVGVGMETGEDFWLQVSTNGGSTFQTVASYASGTDFSNGVRENATVTVTGTFTNTTQVRFRCDASANADYVYIDDIDISGCVNSAREITTDDNEAEIANVQAKISDVTLYPNPVTESFNLQMSSKLNGAANFAIVDMDGRIVKQFDAKIQSGTHTQVIDTDNMQSGVYYINIIQGQQRIIKKFIVIK